MVVVRRAGEGDFPELLAVQREAFAEYGNVYEAAAWTTERLEDLSREATDKVILVAESEGRIVGSVRFWLVGGVCVIRLLSVKPSHQGRGYAKALMKKVEELATEAHKLYVCTMLRTPRNIGLFLGLGYRPESLLPHHYHKLDLICFAKYCDPGPIRPPV
jgi:predicted N-acetyltransferase YhbS